jgi:4,5-DOPA dioxygenase extradiol
MEAMMEQQDVESVSTTLDLTARMPVLFLGHGSPMNAIEDNQFSQAWRRLGEILPKPKAILCISAHWETWGTLVTAMDKPRTIHDFGGFPRELYAQQYPAPGERSLAEQVQNALGLEPGALDQDWGLDHGCWSVLKPMFPQADIPVVQLSLDMSLDAQAKYGLAKLLAPLREQSVLIIGSGNMVHNLRLVRVLSGNFEDFNKPFGFEWAIEANDLMVKLIDERDHQALIDWRSLGRPVELAVNSAEHYLPMLYALALQRPDETVAYFGQVPVGGSLTMTSFMIGRPKNQVA